jgi:CheY-like chemotaxis protein
MIAFIEDNNSIGLSKNYGFEPFPYSDNKNTDTAIDAWIVKFFDDNPSISKLVIPIRLGEQDTSYMGLYIGLHIRLTVSLAEKRFIPLIFISEENKEEILEKQINEKTDKSALLLFTKGCKMIEYSSLESIKDDQTISITEEELKNEVLPQLDISLPERYGNHAISNIWGAYRLAQCMNKKLDTELPKNLYFKVRETQFGKTLELQDNKQYPSNKISPKCQVLLIDDKAEEGWRECVHILFAEQILHSYDVSSFTLDIIKTYEKALEIKSFLKYDLIFLDLRLQIDEDRRATKVIKELSGVKLLDMIKKENNGIQVIILTGSNKAWNMKYLLDNGANGYYIKESPEYNFSLEASKENYEQLKQDVVDCLNRNYLKEFYSKAKTINKKLDELLSDNQYTTGFLKSVQSHIEISLDMHEKAKTEKEHAFSFIMLYFVVEEFAKEFISVSRDHEKNETETRLKYSDVDADRYKWNESTKYVKAENTKKEFTILQKIISICLQKWQYENHVFMRNIDLLIKGRHAFIHSSSKRNVIKKIHKAEFYKELFGTVEKLVSFL